MNPISQYPNNQIPIPKLPNNQKKYQYNNYKRRGFSLIEIMAAIVLLTLILGAMLSAIWSGFASAERSEDRTIAYNLAQEKLEEKLTESPWPPSSESRAQVTGFSGFEREVVVDSPGYGSPIDNDLRRVRVRVYWRTESVEFVNLVANFGH